MTVSAIIVLVGLWAISLSRAYEEGYRVGHAHGLQENFADRRKAAPQAAQ